jgi:FlaA1/EpsC-like NDP-sugar epimerase
VSTDKAANPVNLMGASKRLMEHVTFSHSSDASGALRVTSARFANVAFSDGSLLDGWLRRLEKHQPLAVPRDTRRYFLSQREAGQLCLLAAALAPARHIIIPRLDPETHLKDLESIARRLLETLGYVPAAYTDESRARSSVAADASQRRYPLLLTPLDTSGEKPYEEFIGARESAVELGLPNLMAVPYLQADRQALTGLLAWLSPLVEGAGELPSKRDIVAAIGNVVTEFQHVETDKQLDHRL